ncbi:MAG: permease [Tepidanaerobacteraceae bacterium]|jgi:uncharacterized membrane protein YraQ (UPF0718 family)
MDAITRLFWVICAVGLVISLIKDKKKSLRSLKIVRGMMKTMVSEMVAILFLIGLIVTFIPPEMVGAYLGKVNIFLSTVVAAVIGSITLIPAFVAFPLVGSFVKIGISIVPAVAFLTTLTMVGFVTFPLEKKSFGTKFTLTRNLFSFLFAIIISITMGVLM